MRLTYVHDIFVGANRAYIYIWFSRVHEIIYVGMTNQRVGTLGRAAQHLDIKGTLRVRFEESLGYSIDKSIDLVLFTFPLPTQKEFITVEKSYREAVEYLVQKYLIELQGKLKYSYRVISWVRANERISNSQIISIANNIIREFATGLSNLL